VKKTIIQSITITSISIILGLSRFLFMDKDFKLVKEARILTRVVTENTNDSSTCELPDIMSEPMVIDLDYALCLYNIGRTVFIDARDHEDFSISHIKNSINIPFDYSDDYIYQIDSIDKKTILLTYCSGGECDLSINLADQLFFEEGFFTVLVFEGGFPAWEEKELPIE